MPTINECILLVDNDPEICDLISCQAFKPLGYQVKMVSDVIDAIHQVIKFTPDLIVSSINLPGLSEKDQIVALTSKGFQTPLIVIAKQDQDNEVNQSFRRGVDDYLLWSARDAEVVSLLGRSLSQVGGSRSHQKLDIKLTQVDQESEPKVRELTTSYAVSKAVLSIWDQAILLYKSIETILISWHLLGKGSMHNVCN